MPTDNEEPKTIYERGRVIYETKLRVTLDTPENRGKVLTIEPDSEDYEVNDRLAPAIHLLRARHPDKVVYSMRIGADACTRLRGGRVIKK